MMDPRYATYGAYQQPAAYPTAFAPQQQFYANAYTAAPAAFPGAYPSYQQARGGRGMMMGGGRGFGNPFRGGYQGQQQGYAPQGAVAYGGGYGGRGAGPGAFGMRARRKKPFVGGSLETQRLWEQQTVCCFFLQGQCRFSDGCRFLHESDATRGCQFGTQCRVGHGGTDPQPQPSWVASVPVAGDALVEQE